MGKICLFFNKKKVNRAFIKGEIEMKLPQPKAHSQADQY